MTDYRSTTTIADLAGRILSADRVLITSHIKPDGDAMGSTLAMTRALLQKGKKADLLLMGPVEPSLAMIAERTPYRLVEQQAPTDNYDMAIVLDTSAWSQLEPLAEWLRRHRPVVVTIDHHTRGDDVAPVRLVDASAVSTTAMLVPLLEAMNCPLTGGIGGVAEALFVGLATDSGWFKYGNATAAAFSLAAKLLVCGVDKSRLYQILEENYGRHRLALEARGLASLEYHLGGGAALQMLRIEDFTAAGASTEDTTGLVNAPMVVGSVRLSILLSQTSPGLTKVSFRSKPPPPGADAADFIDVNELAGRLGGGGHVHAAGAKLKTDIDQARAVVLGLLE